MSDINSARIEASIELTISPFSGPFVSALLHDTHHRLIVRGELSESLVNASIEPSVKGVFIGASITPTTWDTEIKLAA